MYKLNNKHILFLILAVAAVLRCYNLFSIPYTHDEFSALFRTHFDSFSELINKGVKLDGHPALVQVFLYYWTSIFGYKEWVVKLPFILLGITCVFLIYRIACLWFNESVALICAAFLASLQFPVMYSQIARPYSSGLFFVLLFVFYWSKIILHPENKFLRNSIGFVIAAGLCAYNHHFSLLFAAIVSLCGLFLINKKYLKYYLLSGIAIFVLYLPHLSIFLFQLQVGGVESWLAKPNPDFLIRFITYIFHFSVYIYLLVISLFFLGLYQNRFKGLPFKKIFLFSSFFFLPFIIGYYYSVYLSAILQFSLLIFNFPFLLFILFGMIKKMTEKFNLLIVCFILLINSFSLIYERKHYSVFYQSPYVQILNDKKKAQKKHPNIACLVYSHKKISAFYDPAYNQEKFLLWLENEVDLSEVKDFLIPSCLQFDLLYFGGTSDVPPQCVPLIREYFPYLIEQNNYAGATTYLFSKTKGTINSIVGTQNFEQTEFAHWKFEESRITSDSTNKNNHVYYLDSLQEWGPSWNNSLWNLIQHKNDFLDISIRVNSFEDSLDFVLVSTLMQKDSIVHWSGTAFSKINQDHYTKGKWLQLHHSLKVSDLKFNSNLLIFHSYVWNNRKQRFLIDDFTIRYRKGNPILYGWFEKI